MAKTFTCKVCREPFDTIGKCAAHRRKAHPETIKPRGSQARRRRAHVDVVPEIDAETHLIVACNDLFAAAQLDRGGDQRVLEYLAQRWGPAAYDDADAEPAEDDDPPEA